MKRNLILIAVFLMTVFLSCKEDPTDPVTPKPAGWQDDILWPSLAASPWPMFRHDPQNTGRSKFQLSLSGTIRWQFKVQSRTIISSISVSRDSVIYAPYESGGLYSLNFDGTVKWKILEKVTHSYHTPIITSDGTIIHSALYGVYSLNPDGTQNWFYGNVEPFGINIDKEGNVYFISSYRLKALNKSGELLWEYYDPDLQTRQTAFSPDGKTLYLSGNTTMPGLMAFDIENHALKWKFGKGGNGWCLVDAQENIYMITQVDSINSGEYSLISLTKDRKVRWSRRIGDYYMSCPTIDKNGNLAYVKDSLFSISYAGITRWGLKYETGGTVNTPLVCDEAGNIFVIREKWQKFDLSVYSQSGQFLFEMQDIEDYPGGSPALTESGIIIPSGNSSSIFFIK